MSTPHPHVPAQRIVPFVIGNARIGLLLLGAATLAVWSSPAKAQTAVDLGSAASFAVLASSGITNVGVTQVTGNVGTAPTATIDGGGSFNFVTGSNHGNDSFTQNAQSAAATAYADAAGRAATPVGGALGGTSPAPGVYSAGTFGITGILTLDAGGNPNAVWIFQAGATLGTAALSQVALLNGAQAANVFWQVGTSATLNGTNFAGSILADQSITVTTGVAVDGRLLALGAHVTLDSNTLTVPSAIPEPAASAVSRRWARSVSQSGDAARVNRLIRSRTCA